MTPFSAVILGGPGLGKSTMAGSITSIVPAAETLLFVAKPGEEQSFKYQEVGLTKRAELFYDKNWRPSLGSFEAGAFTALLQRLQDLQNDTKYGAIIIDPGTDVAKLIEHMILAPNKVGSPGELANTQSYYNQLKEKAQEFVSAATMLATPLVKRPKYVLVPWHVQGAKEGGFIKDPSGAPGAKIKVETADEKSSGIEFRGEVLPMLEGSYRTKLAGDFSMVIYSDIRITKNYKTKVDDVEYVVQVMPSTDKQAKIRMFKSVPVGMLPNDFGGLLKKLGGVV